MYKTQTQYVQMSKKLKQFTSSINLEVHCSCADTLEEQRSLVTLITIFFAKFFWFQSPKNAHNYVKCHYGINFANIIVPAVDLMLTSFHLAK